MKNEFILAFNEVLEEKQLPKDVILQALEVAMVSAYRRDVNASTAQHVECRIDPDSGKVRIFAEKEIVDTVQDDRTEVALTDALKVDPTVTLGGMLIVESTPENFGRVAAQTARQVIQQRLREAERDTQMNHFNKQIGEIISGVVQAITSNGITMGLDMKAEGLLPPNQQVRGERFRLHDRIQALLIEAKQTSRGPQIILSRSHRNFLRRLLENEVPEIYHGMVEIRSIAREPGQRSKVAVAALQPAVDPVGACVGIRGVRIQAIVRELNDEKIDVIEWNNDPAIYISKALSPARVSGVYLIDQNKTTKTATVVVPEDQLSLAIGRDGQNARLAAKLTGWRIDIKSLPEAGSDALHKLQSDPDYAFMKDQETGVVPQIEGILAKKAEGRPVTPEEYQVLSQFVDRIERGLIRRRDAEKRVEDSKIKEIRATIPEAAFAMDLVDLPFSDRLYEELKLAGYDTVGSLMLQLKVDSDAILKLGAIGPKAMDEIKTILNTLDFAAPAVEPEVEVVDQVKEEAAPVAEMPAEPEAVVETVEPAAEMAEAPAAAEKVEEVQPVEASAEADLLAEPAIAEDENGLAKLFALRPEILDPVEPDFEEEDGEGGENKKGKKGKKASKKRKGVEMEYDPDAGVMVVKRKHKNDEFENWDLH